MEVRIIRSNRRTLAIQIQTDCTVVVRAPRSVSRRDIERILKEKEAWINAHIEQMRLRQRESDESEEPPLDRATIMRLKEEAKRYIPERVHLYAEKVGVRYGNITIRNQKTRWGSCSSKRNLNFNCLLMMAPPEVVDYVVVHELCHIKEMNHSKAFWSEVARVIPGYKEQVRWLRSQGSRLIRRMED